MSIRICRLEYLSSDGINTIVSKIYIPDGPVKGVVQIVHGMCEHMDRYDEFMRFLACNGFVACGNNHLGHGESCSCEKDLGYFGDNQGYLHLIRDVHKLQLIMQKDYPQLPYFILGHSMGSFVTRVYLTRYSDGLTGCILSGTGGANPMVRTGIQLSAVACRQRGSHYRPRNIDRIAFGNFNIRIRHPKTKRDWLTRDEEIVARTVEDPYCMFTFTAAGFKDLFSLYYLANTPAAFENIPKNLPILMISGTMDPVGQYGKGVRRVLKSMEEAGVENIRLNLYPEDRHEVLNELDRQKVYNDLLHWLNEQLS